MKNKLLLILLIIFSTSCTIHKKEEKADNTTKDKQEEIQYDDTYIEVIPENAKKFINNTKDADDIIIPLEKIEEYNKDVFEKSNSMYDIDKIYELTKEEKLEYINKYKIPSLPKYNNGTLITEKEVLDILENRNINAIDDNKIQKGIIVKRSNLKSFPTYIHFFDNKEDNNFDKLQETELRIGTGVLVIHESKDGIWNYVISKIYTGWVLKENIAYANDYEYNYLTNNDKFTIIIDSSLEIDGEILDMGVKLPYQKTVKEGYQVVLPIKGKDGYVQRKDIIISKDKAHIGYLPYTKKNIYIEAFKYENEDYSWGGMDKSVDCSSYILNIFSTFGFEFPRNTSSQQNSIGEIEYLTNKSLEDKIKIIEQNNLVVLYQKGHVMLYLGKIDNENYIIHASGSEMKVTVTPLNNSSNYLSQIDRIVKIK